MPVEYRLHVAPKVDNWRGAGNRLDLAGWAPEGHECGAPRIGGRRCSRLVTTDATGDFARLDGHEALHFLDREVVFIKGYEQHATHGRYFKVS